MNKNEQFWGNGQYSKQECDVPLLRKLLLLPGLAGCPWCLALEQAGLEMLSGSNELVVNDLPGSNAG